MTYVPSHLTEHVVASFWSRVDRSAGAGGCWPWTGATFENGYGAAPMGSRGKRARANRLALEIHLGRPLRPGMLACHDCDNPPCCNPGHLYEGTYRQNTQDMIRRGRGRHPVLRGASHPTRFHPGMNAGEHNGRARLSDASVRTIRARIHDGERLAVLAAEFGVSDVAISYAASGRTWAHVG